MTQPSYPVQLRLEGREHRPGEHEVGGTGYLYLASVPFEQLGFPTNLGSKPYPEFTKEFLYGVPIVLALWPPFLLALSNARKASLEKTDNGAG